MVTEIDYKRYIEKMDALIRDKLHEMECQPIFFVGSGLSKRYIGTPSWLELLEAISSFIGTQKSAFNYIIQKRKGELIAIADDVEDLVFEWAWKEKPDLFPREYFEANVDKSIYMKTVACKIIDDIFRKNIGDAKPKDEIALLKASNPHAIITTNYDCFLEELFVGYESVVGDKVIKYNLNLVGEIFKIHGSTTDPSSIVLNSEDYRDYRIRKKYISAKLLTYLTEHPVFIFGYGFNDPNITEIIQDVGEIVGDDGFIDNIFYVKWEPDLQKLASLNEEYIVSGGGGAQYRVRAISTLEFSWIFKAISQDKEFNPINTKILRALAARTYKLIRKDIPQKTVEVDYKNLESILGTDEDLPKLLGIVSSHNSNMTHPYTITQLGRRLGYPGWHGARNLIEKVNKEKGVNIVAADNQYHCLVKTGDKSRTSKYSKEALRLLEKVRDGKEYAIPA